MATTGSAAWSKYYQGKGDLETVVKKDSPLFDAETGASLSKTVPKGTKVVAIATKAFEARTPVKLPNGTLVRISLDNLVKPGKKGAAASTISLKPQAFGISDTKMYSFEEYTKTVIEGIETSDLPMQLKSYLLALVDWYVDKGSQAKYNLLWAYDTAGLPISDIEKDFGEVLGPIALLSFPEVAKKKGIILNPKTTKIFVPSRPNEPLMDYKMITDTKNNTGYLVSAKTQGTSNTVKPADILDLLAKDDASLKKWSKAKEYAVFQILADKQYSSVTAPAAAAFALAASGDPLFSGFSKTQPKGLVAGMPKAGKVSADVLSSCAKFVSNNEYLKKIKGSPTSLELNYEIEKLLVTWSKQNQEGLTAMFLDAVANRVKYVKFGGIARKQPQFEFVAESKMAENGVQFRSKSGYTRSADKLGIQT